MAAPVQTVENSLVDCWELMAATKPTPCIEEEESYDARFSEAIALLRKEGGEVVPLRMKVTEPEEEFETCTVRF